MEHELLVYQSKMGDAENERKLKKKVIISLHTTNIHCMCVSIIRRVNYTYSIIAVTFSSLLWRAQ